MIFVLKDGEKLSYPGKKYYFRFMDEAPARYIVFKRAASKVWEDYRVNTIPFDNIKYLVENEEQEKENWLNKKNNI